MKKVKFLVGIVGGTIAVWGGLKAYDYVVNRGINILLMNNVEALTSSESGGSNPQFSTCYAYGYDSLTVSNQYACEGQRPDDTPKTCVARGFFRGHDDYKRNCILP